MLLVLLYNVKQKHPGYKKVRGQWEAALHMHMYNNYVTKSFDISWGQEVTHY